MSVLAIADTGFLYAYLDPDDQHHAWAREQFTQFPAFVTCEAVLTEVAHLTGTRLNNPHLALDMIALGVLDIGYSVHGDASDLRALMAKYADVPMDLADACLVRMTEQHRRHTLLTVDSDFLIYRRHGDQVINVLTP
ncbi:MAG: PIN domain-containing protein [Bacteroidetes bacterium]|jgi:predicted nucleic acid-binding protein|nr:PIN domain-containing protein [Bacteroidota bacterium]